jgi:hypothetical protein
MTAGLLHCLRVFEPGMQWMKLNHKTQGIDLAARATAEPTTIYEVVPDNLLLVTMWLEHSVGNNFVILDESF